MSVPIRATPAQTNVQIPAFDQATHESVMEFLGRFNTINLKEMKAQSTTVRTICSIAAIAFACAAALAYKTAHKHAAIGLGIGGGVILVAGIVKGVRATEEFIDLSKSITKANEHLRHAYLSKATFMIEKNLADPNTYNEGSANAIANLYDDADAYTTITLESLTLLQKPWQINHKELKTAVTAISYPKPADIKDPAVKNLLIELYKATLIFRKGRIVNPTSATKYTYICYPPGGPATFWESAGVSTTSANA